ncbi:MAG TPA: preprotein translocase subunit SecY [Alphaproteobacteria bacterium]|nr:preprotein translocase subunit SecY [Alphaproteobacteria bacterium]
MASAAEQLASNINLGAFGKAKELKKRIWFTLGALLVYRLGTYIPLPGIDTNAFSSVLEQNSGGIFGIFNLFSGGALQRMTIFALNIMPYISASIIVQLLTAVLPRWEALKKEGEAGRRKLNQYTRLGTVFLAALQGFGIVTFIESMRTQGGGSIVLDPGLFFRVSVIVTLVGATMFLMWLGEQITARGIGNGISLIIFAGIVANFPSAIAELFSLARAGSIKFLGSPTLALLMTLAFIGLVVLIVVFFERAQRRLVIQYPKRQVGNKVLGGDNSHLPLRLNTAGVIPPIFASSLLLLPVSIFQFSSSDQGGMLLWLQNNLNHGTWLYIALYLLLILFFAFFYTAIVFNPEETADNLKKNGGFIPGIRPGKATAEYIDYVLTRLTVLGALYLAFICVLPEIVIADSSLPFYFGGTSLLIIVSVTIDTVGQIHSHLLANQYEGLIRKSKLKGSRG